MVFGGCGPARRAQQQDERRGRRNATKEPHRAPHGSERKGARENAPLVGQWVGGVVDPPPPPPLPAAIAIPMTAAAPRAIQPIVPADMPFAVCVPAASPAAAAPLPLAGGIGAAPGIVGCFFGHVSNVSSAAT